MKKAKKVYKYTAFFEKNELDGYTVTVPSLPGLTTEGKTMDEAQIMAEDAVRCYVEGLKKLQRSVPLEGASASVAVIVAV